MRNKSGHNTTKNLNNKKLLSEKSYKISLHNNPNMRTNHLADIPCKRENFLSAGNLL